MKPISKLRFDSLAGYVRVPYMPLVVRELEWYQHANEKVLGVLLLIYTTKIMAMSFLDAIETSASVQ